LGPKLVGLCGLTAQTSETKRQKKKAYRGYNLAMKQESLKTGISHGLCRIDALHP